MGIGIDENRLIRNVKRVEGDAYLSDSQITSLGNLESIGGNVYIENLKLTPEDFASVKIGGEIYK